MDWPMLYRGNLIEAARCQGHKRRYLIGLHEPRVAGTPRRARVPPVDYRDKLQTPSGPLLRRRAGPISHRR